ncbi:5-carboxymethyl-2-hydroxymuconate Delta-isomerase [Serratia fonticola]|uniref:5-carboxymethyl-2-hydroxymuconate Delta-isomerase n=1 Tax=Serratia fonticola TaxID=47917 RepID=A0A4U9TZW8_SERFO|nr:5-carboxymethyl-2-hydroxymuconate Delta-isomerase [Serratia fonticola]
MATAAAWKAANRWAKCWFILIKDHFAALMAKRYLALSFTMEELDPVLNYKQNNVHALFSKD